MPSSRAKRAASALAAAVSIGSADTFSERMGVDRRGPDSPPGYIARVGWEQWLMRRAIGRR